MKTRLLLILFSIFFTPVFSQDVKLVWASDIVEYDEDQNSFPKPYFADATYFDSEGTPYYKIARTFNSNINGAVINIENEIWESISKPYDNLNIDDAEASKLYLKKFDNKTLVQAYVNAIRKEPTTGILQRLISFDYNLEVDPSSKRTRDDFTFRSSTNSEMASGTWIKIAVTSTGVQKITSTFFTNFGIDITSVNPKNVKVFGYSEGMLPETPWTNTPNTIPEIPIMFFGESDGVFNAEDYFLFFAKAANVWEWNPSEKEYYHEKHLYTDTSFYWVNFSGTAGKRITYSSQSASPATKSFSTYENHQFTENDNTNLIKTGRRWFGDYFSLSSGVSKNYSFNFPNKVPSENVHFKANYVIRSNISLGNNFIFSSGGSTVHTSANVNSVSTSYTSPYAKEGSAKDSFNISGSIANLNITYSYPSSSSEAWLDWLEIKTECNLIFNGTPLFFSQPKSVGDDAISQFSISNTDASTMVWDVTSPYETSNIEVDWSSSQTTFKVATDSIKSFVAVGNSGFKSPSYIGVGRNQNLLSLTDIDYIIVTPAVFKPYAQELAKTHENYSNLSTAVVELQEIYNEFSNGHADITAIRNYMKYLYYNASSDDTRIKYLMLFSDASYDPKQRAQVSTHEIPSYQSTFSLSPTQSFVSDDYYGMLDDQNGITFAESTVDIGIGRFPARNITDAAGYVAKVQHYINSSNMVSYDGNPGSDIKSTFDDWKNKVVFIADDGSLSDGYTDRHLTQTEGLVDSLLEVDSTFNVKKLYLDAFEKKSTPGGARYPDVNREIFEAMREGAMFVSYIGHGGEVGWADERVLTVDEINAWDNIDAMPVFVTATCEFSRYDDPERTSGGEYTILNPNGGAISMLTTTRLVYGGERNNIGFSRNFYKQAMLKNAKGQSSRLGDATRMAKVLSDPGFSYNNRKFALLGDPALRMAMPKYDVITTKVNDVDLALATDTLKALSKVKIEGEIRLGGAPINMNGFIYPIVYDKAQSITTLNNNGTGASNYETFNSILYKGTSTVTDGKFSFEFVVPKDINYSFGNGRISYYFANDTTDGSGYNEKIMVGGSSSEGIIDEDDPVVELFMNDSNFIFGGLTDENPYIYAVISDENGINTSGTSLGHDITAVIDEDYSNPIILNDYYTAALNNYKKGTIRYPLSNLEDGLHTITLKAWDVNNNSGKAYTEFIVANDAKLAIKHVFNYPNPFTTKTNFLFEHNQINQNLDVQIKIYTITGKVIKTIDATVNSLGNTKTTPIEWDGLDDYGDKIGRGVYLYQLEVKSPSGDSESKLQKLVILR